MSQNQQMSVVARDIPDGARTILMKFKKKYRSEDDPDFWMINLGGWEEDIQKIMNAGCRITSIKKIYIHFPIPTGPKGSPKGGFYVKAWESPIGFTRYDLVEKIYKTGVEAFAYDMAARPDHYTAIATADDIMGEYAITDGDLKMKTKNIYISVQH